MYFSSRKKVDTHFVSKVELEINTGQLNTESEIRIIAYFTHGKTGDTLDINLFYLKSYAANTNVLNYIMQKVCEFISHPSNKKLSLYLIEIYNQKKLKEFSREHVFIQYYINYIQEVPFYTEPSLLLPQLHEKEL